MTSDQRISIAHRAFLAPPAPLLKRITLALLALSLIALITQTSVSSMSNEERFSELQSLNWTEVYHDPCTGNWEGGWFLDGLRASVDNTPGGMVLSAGPIAKDHASHCVLWTKQSFEGDLKIEFDYWRIDTIQQFVNIIYIQATGIEKGPFTKDIAEWSELREIPYMRSYFMNMKALHISFAAFGADPSEEDYVRLRRYPRGEDQKFTEIAVMPDNLNTGLFKPGIKHRFTIIKKGDEVLFHVATDEKTLVFAWNTSDYDPITEGRIGLRHMWTRCSRYADFKVSKLSE
ncbi:TPA: hypothetical protein DCE37_23600 [Candidatus Latescibacteria bacterium]|nr:hypothetical protein [Candidatus Latescibacterota bacterium]|tara:strand:- start:1362 stop:2228 length:867 start_codon:yes stop_codon:yes gene_type:complete